ncbi:hypothetical protein HYC85_020855 [Camellia sinensis]|uniref:Uncharacterized protein n=1 Tax=Camellia sinensis TaxID=4442 RepID=A0A7J7GR18_CAMSI|nr:hypothetical protein HYC85_020855 [Camellia sinensis]
MEYKRDWQTRKKEKDQERFQGITDELMSLKVCNLGHFHSHPPSWQLKIFRVYSKPNRLNLLVFHCRLLASMTMVHNYIRSEIAWRDAKYGQRVQGLCAEVFSYF